MVNARPRVRVRVRVMVNAGARVRFRVRVMVNARWQSDTQEQRVS